MWPRLYVSGLSRVEMLRLFCNQSGSKTEGAFAGFALLSFQTNHKNHTFHGADLSGSQLYQRWAQLPAEEGSEGGLWLTVSTAEMPSTRIHSRSSKSLHTCFAAVVKLMHEW